MPSPSPKPKPTKKGIKVALGGGVTMDLKTGKKTTVKPSPKVLPTKSNKDYFKGQRDFIKSRTTNK